jgi:predicted secreted protein
VVLTDGLNTYVDTFPFSAVGYLGPLYFPVGTHVLSIVSVRRLLSGCVHYILPCLTPNNLNYTVVVVANDLPPLSITGGGAVCNGQPIVLTASPGFSEYSWNSNGGNGQSISVNTPGTYTVYASNGGVCNSSASISVASIPFTPPVISGPPSVCAGQPATLSVNNTAYSSYQWSLGGSGSSIIATAPGTYTATVTSADGCTGTASFTLGNLPIPNASISNVPNICPGQTVTLTANGGTAYVWNTGQTTANITVTAGGSFTVTATASNGCTATATSSILQRPLPTVQFALPQSDICGGDCVTVQVTLTGTAPFSLTYSVASAAAITTIFSGTTGTIQVCVPVGTALGPLQIQATSLTDAWCNCN